MWYVKASSAMDFRRESEFDDVRALFSFLIRCGGCYIFRVVEIFEFLLGEIAARKQVVIWTFLECNQALSGDLPWTVLSKKLPNQAEFCKNRPFWEILER